MDLSQDSPEVRNLRAKNENLKARLRALEDENRQLRQLQSDTFFYFTRLPLEIRITIWERALPDRRVVRVAELPRGN